jgi:nitric oxide reductase subunit C
MPAEKKKTIAIVLLCVIFFSYSFCLYLMPPAKVEDVSEETGYGKLLWQQHNCNACHQVYGLGGFLGPDLTNTYSSRGPAYIKAFLQSGTATMPNFHFNDQELKALVAYLQNIDASGKADPRTFRINVNGTIEK